MQGNARGKPVVLVLAGHDPGGGAGIQADIEAIAANGCHAATVITCLTTQNTAEFRKYIPVCPEDFLQQTELILAETRISACKIGLIADPGILSAIEKILLRFKKTPVVFDPVISAGSGEKIMTDDIIMSLRDKLLPLITVLTPNTIEARALAGVDDISAAAHKLLKHGCQSVLITGTHEPTGEVINTLYLEHETPIKFSWDRLDGTYHGSGCTLSAAISAYLARGEDIKQAVAVAQKYTWNTLKHGMWLGGKQDLPDRFYKG
ncbi:MAG: bifunctional hydroxymethylpyrimidine kinase/phosphomethylpyrimidine kinase [Gammaproteobacteria bacterium]